MKTDERGVTEDCLEFHDVDEHLGINLVPLSGVPFIPRTGETVLLPGEQGLGEGTYEVVSVLHFYAEETGSVEQPAQARLLKISIGVRKAKHVRKSVPATAAFFLDTPASLGRTRSTFPRGK